MKEDFIAETPETLAKNIRKALLDGRLSEKVAREALQMARLLESLAFTQVLQYPVRVRHTSEDVPDFQLVLDNRRIAVEVTRIKFQDIECARKLQQTTIKSTLMISSLYPKPGRPRKRSEIVAQGFGIPTMVFPPSVDEENQAWLKQARDMLDAKTSVVTRKDFAHGDQDWLVIIDPIWSYQPEIHHGQNGFSELLASYWKPNWYSRVFLQDNYYHWQMVFTPSESCLLPGSSA